MRRCIVLSFVVFTLAAGCLSKEESESSSGAVPVASSTAAAPVTSFALTSPAFEDGGLIPTQYTCDGENMLPPLSIAGAPDGTQSFAITVVDGDAPSGDFVHWTVWSIDPATTDIAEGSVPGGAVQGNTGTGAPGFIGPCPPSGEHRYVFTLYALDNVTELDAATTGRAELEAAIEGHVIAQTTLTGLYSR